MTSKKLNNTQLERLRGAFQSISQHFPIGKSELSVVFIKDRSGTIKDFGYRVVAGMSLCLVENPESNPFLELLSGKFNIMEAEPIAMLAAKKGRLITEISNYSNSWQIGICSPNEVDPHYFEALTYIETENKAREYLNTLLDKEAK